MITIKKLNAFRMLAVLVALMLSVESMAREIFKGTVIVPSLNMREAPDTSSNVIGQMSLNDRIFLINKYGDWLYIFNNGKFGYVHSDFIKIDTLPTVLNIGSEEECSTDLSNTYMRSTATDFDCREDYSGGYRSCSVEVSVSVESDCDKVAEAFVSCDALFSYKTQDGYISSRGFENGNTSLYVDNGFGHSTLWIEWSPRSYYSPVVSVKLESVSCSMTDVFD